MSHFQTLLIMNLINKKNKIHKGALLSAFALFLSLMSCGSEAHHIGSNSTRSNHTPDIKREMPRAYQKFLDHLGGIGTCGYDCIMSQVGKDAIATGKQEKLTKKGEKKLTYAIPKEKDGLPYFQTIAGKPTGASKKAKKLLIFPGKPKAVYVPQEGMFGKMELVYQHLLAKQKNNRREARFYAFAMYMQLIQKCREILASDDTIKEEVRRRLELAINEFINDLISVRPGKGRQGKKIVIDENGVLTFVDRTKEHIGNKNRHLLSIKDVEFLRGIIQDLVKEVNAITIN